MYIEVRVSIAINQDVELKVSLDMGVQISISRKVAINLLYIELKVPIEMTATLFIDLVLLHIRLDGSLSSFVSMFAY